MVEKVLNFLDELGESFKSTLLYMIEVLVFCTERYDDIFGYPFGGMLLWSIVWLLVMSAALTVKSSL